MITAGEQKSSTDSFFIEKIMLFVNRGDTFNTADTALEKVYQLTGIAALHPQFF